MLELKANIKIAKFQFTQMVSVEINKSTLILSNTAIIELPLTAVLENKEILSLEKSIKRGDSVEIKLSYNSDTPNTEFVGYVTKLTAQKTLKIECEDLMFTLRKPLANKGFSKTSVKEIIAYITNIQTNANNIDFVIDNFIIKNTTAIQALEKLKTDYGLTIFIDADNKLYVGLAYLYTLTTRKYNLNKNIVQSDLTFKKADETKIKIKAISVQKDNSRIEKEVGDADGELRTLYFRGISNEKELEKLATEEMQKYKYDGYDGKITSFGIPFAQIGDLAYIIDENYPQREGTYYIESVKTTFGQSGFRRELELGIKL